MQNLSVEIINQLSDNYSYLIFNNNNSSSIIIDPAEAEIIIDLLKQTRFRLYFYYPSSQRSYLWGFELIKRIS